MWFLVGLVMTSGCAANTESRDRVTWLCMCMCRWLYCTALVYFAVRCRMLLVKIMNCCQVICCHLFICCGCVLSCCIVFVILIIMTTSVHASVEIEERH